MIPLTLPTPTPWPTLPATANATWRRRVVASIDPDAWVHADPFRSHVRMLLATTPLPWRALAIAGGVPPTAVRAILCGTGGRAPRLRASDAASLMLLTPDVVRHLTRQPARPAALRSRLQVLGRHGHDTPRLATWLATTPREVQVLLEGGGTPALDLEVRAAAACSSIGLDGVWALEHWQGHLLRGGSTHHGAADPARLPDLAA